LALHLLLQRLEGLIDIVVKDENLHASFLLARYGPARYGPGCAGARRSPLKRDRAGSPLAAPVAESARRVHRRAQDLPSSGVSATASVCRWRQASSRFASSPSASASTLAASSAALTAPARPIASVPTGTPGGICTIE